MKRTLAILTAGALALGASLAAQTMVREIQFDTYTDFLTTPPDVYVGEVGGVGTNSKGHIFVYTRTGHGYATLGDNRTFHRGGSRLFEFDANGTFMRELGQDVYGFNNAIGLRVDREDNVWTIDQGANQVVKFDPDGRVALVLGRKPETMSVRLDPPGAGGGRGRGQTGPPGSGTPGSSFSMPTDVAWDQQGNIYVADGIGNTNRIAKLDRTGRFIKHWGSTGSGPGQFNGVKGIAIDSQGNVYVADVGNKRIQVFDAEGTFKSQFGNVGTPLAICISPGATQYLYVSHSGDPDGMEDAAIYKVQLDGRVVGKFGSAGKLPKEFGLANSLDCRSENELLVGEMTNWRVQRLTLRP